MIGILPSRRAHLITAQAEYLSEQCDLIVGLHNIDVAQTWPGKVIHHDGTFPELVNRLLALADADAVLWLDDDNQYPEDHYKVMEHWEPAHSVFGSVNWQGCDGTPLKYNNFDICAGVCPTNIRLFPDRSGRLADSIRSQTIAKHVPAGVVKRVCPADWSWNARVPGKNKIECNHSPQQPAGTIGTQCST